MQPARIHLAGRAGLTSPLVGLCEGTPLVLVAELACCAAAADVFAVAGAGLVGGGARGDPVAGLAGGVDAAFGDVDGGCEGEEGGDGDDEMHIGVGVDACGGE